MKKNSYSDPTPPPTFANAPTLTPALASFTGPEMPAPPVWLNDERLLSFELKIFPRIPAVLDPPWPAAKIPVFYEYSINSFRSLLMNYLLTILRTLNVYRTGQLEAQSACNRFRSM